MWPHRRQPSRLLCPWDSPGKNTRVGCHFLPLVNIFCTFFILFPRSWIIFTVIIMNYFSGRFPISNSFSCFSGVLCCPFICRQDVFISFFILISFLWCGIHSSYCEIVILFAYSVFFLVDEAKCLVQSSCLLKLDLLLSSTWTLIIGTLSPNNNCYFLLNVSEALLNVALIAPYMQFTSVKGHLQVPYLNICHKELWDHMPYHSLPTIRLTSNNPILNLSALSLKWQWNLLWYMLIHSRTHPVFLSVLNVLSIP